jgi:hypothetical protein
MNHFASAASAAFLTMLGLALFEIVSSLDNAVVNANILNNVRDPKARRFFVTWGMICSVGIVRGLLPFIIYYIPNMHLGFHKAMVGFWTGDPAVVASVQSAAPYLVMAGGMFLTLLFLHWLIVEEKTTTFPFEDMLQKAGGAWFFAAAGALLVGIMYLIKTHVSDPQRGMNLMLAAAVGISIFFIADGFKEHAEVIESRLIEESDSAKAALSDWSKVLFLEVIDATFSTDGVVGAFAFTMVVPFILVGNGIGAYVVRRLTLGNVERLNNYEFLKNGAMYSIGLLGLTMTLEGFGIKLPFWVSPLITFACVGGFLLMSIRANSNKENAVSTTV